VINESEQGVFSKVGDVVNGQGGRVLGYALTLAAVGTLAMALVEITKSVLRLQLRYNRWSVQRWTRGAPRALWKLMAALPSFRATTPSRAFDDANATLSELLLLSAGGHDEANALFDQPVEKMMGQIQAAVNVAMDFPQEYPHLYGFITKIPNDYWLHGAANNTSQDDVRWAQGMDKVHRIRTSPPQSAPLDPATLSEAQASAQARARLNNLVARRLDAFQNETQYFWMRLNQWAATILGTVIFAIALHTADDSLSWIVLILLSIPAGVVAPFAKQLSTSLMSFGGKK
jgi:hypothetical protein